MSPQLVKYFVSTLVLLSAVGLPSLSYAAANEAGKAQPAQVDGLIVMQGGPDLALPYNNVTVRGQWMYPREAPIRMIALIRAGLIDLKSGDVTTFPLADINAAVEHAALNAGPFQMTVVQP